MLWILFGIILFFTLILSLRVSVDIKYTDKLVIKLKYGPIPLEPILKWLTNGRANPKKEKKRPKEEKTAPESSEKKGIIEIIEEVTAALNKFSSCFFKGFRIKVANVIITVGTKDPAKTAMLYGTVVQAAAIFVDYLEEHTDFKTSRNAQIRVDPDFVSGKSSVYIDIRLSVTVFHVLVSGVKTLISYITVSKQHKTNKQTAENNGEKGLV